MDSGIGRSYGRISSFQKHFWYDWFFRIFNNVLIFFFFFWFPSWIGDYQNMKGHKVLQIRQQIIKCQKSIARQIEFRRILSSVCLTYLWELVHPRTNSWNRKLLQPRDHLSTNTARKRISFVILMISAQNPKQEKLVHIRVYAKLKPLLSISTKQQMRCFLSTDWSKL